MGMSIQEVYDKVKTHLLAQGKRSVFINKTDNTNGNNCAYRSPEGLSCAVGCLIPDKLYTPDIENISVWGLVRNSTDTYRPDIADLFDKDVIESGLLQELQAIHDSENPKDWQARLETLAWHFGLIP